MLEFFSKKNEPNESKVEKLLKIIPKIQECGLGDSPFLDDIKLDLEEGFLLSPEKKDYLKKMIREYKEKMNSDSSKLTDSNLPDGLSIYKNNSNQEIEESNTISSETTLHDESQSDGSSSEKIEDDKFEMTPDSVIIKDSEKKLVTDSDSSQTILQEITDSESKEKIENYTGFTKNQELELQDIEELINQINKNKDDTYTDLKSIEKVHLRIKGNCESMEERLTKARKGLDSIQSRVYEKNKEIRKLQDELRFLKDNIVDKIDKEKTTGS